MDFDIETVPCNKHAIPISRAISTEDFAGSLTLPIIRKDFRHIFKEDSSLISVRSILLDIFVSGK
jgi:hypothetical protein